MCTANTAVILHHSHVHQQLFQQLKEHAAKWREIGTHLGFSQGELNVIQAMPGLFYRAPEGFLEQMLTEWLQWNRNQGSKDNPTLDKLKIAMDKAGLAASAEQLHV